MVQLLTQLLLFPDSLASLGHVCNSESYRLLLMSIKTSHYDPNCWCAQLWLKKKKKKNLFEFELIQILVILYFL